MEFLYSELRQMKFQMRAHTAMWWSITHLRDGEKDGLKAIRVILAGWLAGKR